MNKLKDGMVSTVPKYGAHPDAEMFASLPIHTRRYCLQVLGLMTLKGSHQRAICALHTETRSEGGKILWPGVEQPEDYPAALLELCQGLDEDELYLLTAQVARTLIPTVWHNPTMDKAHPFKTKTLEIRRHMFTVLCSLCITREHRLSFNLVWPNGFPPRLGRYPYDLMNRYESLELPTMLWLVAALGNAIAADMDQQTEQDGGKYEQWQQCA